jgi:hypothetical protein
VTPPSGRASGSPTAATSRPRARDRGVHVARILEPEAGAAVGHAQLDDPRAVRKAQAAPERPVAQLLHTRHRAAAEDGEQALVGERLARGQAALDHGFHRVKSDPR